MQDMLPDKKMANAALPTRRATYRAPTLTVFGSVAALTHGAFTSTNGDAGQLMMDPPNCERHLKENIVEIGRHPLGIGLYLFDYKTAFQAFGRGRQFGVMVDEVEAVMPEAVLRDDAGFKRVDHAMLGIRRPAR